MCIVWCLKLVCKDVETLQRLAADMESELETLNTIPEEFAGRLRAAAGKARLLATQKLAQFQGLCKKNIVSYPLLSIINYLFMYFISFPHYVKYIL